MNKKIFSIFVGIAIAAFCVSSNVNAIDSFKDVTDKHANYKAIEHLKKNNIIGGYSDGNYKPDNKINRAEFTKIIIEAYHHDKDEIKKCDSDSFKDVRKGYWFSKYICIAKKEKIIKGYSDNSFKPNQNITFAEASKMIFIAKTLSNMSWEFKKDFDFSTYQGDNIITHWFEEYVIELDHHNAIPNSITKLNQTINRGEMAEIIYRLGNNWDTYTLYRYPALLYNNYIKPRIKLDLSAPKDAIEKKERSFKADVNKTYIVNLNTAKKKGEGCKNIDLDSIEKKINNLNEELSPIYKIFLSYIKPYNYECVSIDTDLGFTYTLMMQKVDNITDPTKIGVKIVKNEAKEDDEFLYAPISFEVISIDKEVEPIPLAAHIKINDINKLYTHLKDNICKDIESDKYKKTIESITGSKCEGDCVKEACIYDAFQGFYGSEYEFYSGIYTAEQKKDLFKSQMLSGISVNNFDNRNLFMELGCVARYIPVKFASGKQNETVHRCVGTLPEDYSSNKTK